MSTTNVIQFPRRRVRYVHNGLVWAACIAIGVAFWWLVACAALALTGVV